MLLLLLLLRSAQRPERRSPRCFAFRRFAFSWRGAPSLSSASLRAWDDPGHVSAGRPRATSAQRGLAVRGSQLGGIDRNSWWSIGLKPALDKEPICFRRCVGPKRRFFLAERKAQIGDMLRFHLGHWHQEVSAEEFGCSNSIVLIDVLGSRAFLSEAQSQCNP